MNAQDELPLSLNRRLRDYIDANRGEKSRSAFVKHLINALANGAILTNPVEVKWTNPNEN
ncbi:hypothetical protein D3C81_745760 [compost metagenome]|nr:Uncharacterised protein [Serratia quinivorans]